jgi:type VI secretion system secreted protein VgrG
MIAYLQADRSLTVTTPLGPDTLLLQGFTGQEAISQLFHFDLDLLAENRKEVPFDQLLGQNVTVQLVLPRGKKRFFSGICKRVTQGGRDRIFTAYRMEMVPQFWLLTKRVQCRIFQNLTVPHILKKVLSGLNVVFETVGSFHPRNYCVQYRESDFQFASRLMEEEGIFYFFKHTAHGHQMVVANTPQSHPNLPDASPVVFEEIEGGLREEQRITRWEKSQELRAGKYTLWDQCFQLPGRNLEAQKTIPESIAVGRVAHKLRMGANQNLEIFDYPGGYAQRFDGIDKDGKERPGDLQKIYEDNQRTVALRMQEETAAGLVIQGASNCGHLLPGHRFTLERHFSGDGAYVLIRVNHVARLANAYRSNGIQKSSPNGVETSLTKGLDQRLEINSRGPEYENSFTCIPMSLPYRPPRLTPKPTVQGPQTATVVGPPGEQIFTDKFGRAKVQFHWDRQGKHNPDSACWLRVSSVGAGKGFGFINLPRVGQEVIVDFLEGDPDRPLITGSVYNAEQMPPLKLPEERMECGLISFSIE